MEVFILYIVKVAICLGMFLAIYAVFLRNTTFLKFNRLFLVFGLVVSLLLASITPTYDVVISMPAVTIDSQELVANNPDVSTAYSVWNILVYVYLAGATFVLLRNVFSYLKIYRLIQRGKKTRGRGFVLIENPSVDSAFTVLKYILLNSSNLSKVEKDLILKHEITHIKQRHWVDLLCSECMLVLQWFNPLAWIYVRVLKENHEFLADKAVLASGVSPYVYQAVLVNQEFKGPVFSFVNSFKCSKPLNRLSMMKKEKSAWWKRLTVLIIIPMFGLFLWASAEPNYIMKDFSTGIQEESSLEMDTVKSKTQGLKVYYMGHIVEKRDSSYIQLTAVPKEDVENVMVFVDGVEVARKDLKTSPEDIDNIAVLKGDAAIEKYGEKGKNGVIIITTKKGKEKSVENTTALKGKITAIKSEDADSMRVLKGEVTVIGYGRKAGNGVISIDTDSKGKMQDALILVDGKKVSTTDDIKPEDVESMTVLKGEAAMEKYGEEGKNGVIHIKMKKKGSGINEALILVDGKKVEGLDDIDKNEIESISILKDKSATDEYGDEGKNGVVLIEMKKK